MIFILGLYRLDEAVKYTYYVIYILFINSI
jgi:hypothetical protein